MRYPIKKYAQALYESAADKSKKEQEKILAQFLVTLDRYHDRSLLSRIIESYEKFRRDREGIVKVEVTTATKAKSALLEKIEKKFSQKVEFEEKVAPEVLGGVRVMVNDEYLIDGTYQGRVDKLYKALVNAND